VERRPPPGGVIEAASLVVDDEALLAATVGDVDEDGLVSLTAGRPGEPAQERPTDASALRFGVDGQLPDIRRRLAEAARFTVEVPDQPGAFRRGKEEGGLVHSGPVPELGSDLGEQPVMQRASCSDVLGVANDHIHVRPASCPRSGKALSTLRGQLEVSAEPVFFAARFSACAWRALASAARRFSRMAGSVIRLRADFAACCF